MDERSARPRIELVKKQREIEESTRSGVIHTQATPASQPAQASPPASAPSAPLGNTAGVLPAGTILDSKYVVNRVIGAGAFGLVYEATNLELDEKVALKMLRPEAAVDTGIVARFAREAKSAAAIKSEYVCSVYDVGTNADGTAYIVMEYLEGKTLDQVIEEQGPLGPRTAVEYALQICEALAVAHAKGIIHRDVKPDNLLLAERAGGMRIVKVLDFGISKAALTGSVFGAEVPIVKTMNLMGTPMYMSPEQVRCTGVIDARSDIWSLGLVLYEILAHATAFEGTSIPEICAAILESKPRPIELYRNDLPSGLVAVIMKCLEKDVSRRYQNVAELAFALMPFGPKRSRLNVERAVTVLQGVGLVDADLRIESVIPPPSSSTEISVPIPRPPHLERIEPVEGTPVSASSSSTSSISSSPPEPAIATPSARASSAPTLAPPNPIRAHLVLVAIITVLLGICGIGFLVAPRLSHSEARTTAPTASTAPTAPAAMPTTSAPAEAAPAASSPTVSIPSAAASPAAANVTATPAAATTHPAAPTAPAPVAAPAPFRGAPYVPPSRGRAGATGPTNTPPAATAANPGVSSPPAAANPAPTATPAETSTGRTFRRSM